MTDTIREALHSHLLVHKIVPEDEYTLTHLCELSSDCVHTAGTPLRVSDAEAGQDAKLVHFTHLDQVMHVCMSRPEWVRVYYPYYLSVQGREDERYFLQLIWHDTGAVFVKAQSVDGGDGAVYLT